MVLFVVIRTDVDHLEVLNSHSILFQRSTIFTYNNTVPQDKMNVFSFCLYGGYNDRYYPGMIENILLIHKHYPGWFVFVYTGSDVTPEMMAKLRSAPYIVVKPTGKTGIENMIERFTAIDEPDVNVMFVRDADSRVHWKDRLAINDFMASPEFFAHTIRDHYEHTASLMGGLWGLRKSAGINIRREYEAYKMNPEDRGIALDQNFLSVKIYPKVQRKLLVHHGNGPVNRFETVRPFPTPWTEALFCGQIERPGFVEAETTIQRRPAPFRLKLSR